MKTVQQLLESKRHSLISVAPSSTVLDALKVMAEKEIGAVVVILVHASSPLENDPGQFSAIPVLIA